MNFLNFFPKNGFSIHESTTKISLVFVEKESIRFQRVSLMGKSHMSYGRFFLGGVIKAVTTTTRRVDDEDDDDDEDD